ncbi:MAG: hypothetical protein IAG13_38390 [Deltaproteobacteria bacterium]|nr:hypothetical protein [Nannocystaceae bacterium]
MGAKLIAILLLGTSLLGCSHTHASWGASPQHRRERRAVIGEGVLVEATRWDAGMVESAAAEHEHADRKQLLARLRGRYLDGVTAFTVVLELRDRPGGTQGLERPESWWFEVGDGHSRSRAAAVELLAVDRFPAANGRAHLRIALDVSFVGRREGELDLRVGLNRPKGRKRAELGPALARRGALLRWDAR